MQKKLHNPKSNAPAVYIPCWLIQVSSKLLSPGAKLLYGQLTQCMDEHGKANFNTFNLYAEIGSSCQSVDDHIKELKKCGLIGTYKNVENNTNHLIFYEHPWMHEPIQGQLDFIMEDSQ